MPTAIDVMKQIWEQENIWVEIRSNKTNLPRYSVPRKYPKNKKVADWIQSRLSAYDGSIITVKKGNGTIASDQTNIEKLRCSYTDKAIELIETKLLAGLKEKKIKKIKKQQVIIKKEASQVKLANSVISAKALGTEEDLVRLKLVEKFAKHVCVNIEKAMLKTCTENGISIDICNK